jgi:hypothetical protein
LPALGFVTVKLSDVLLPTSTDAAPKFFDIVGLSRTVNVAEAVFPLPASTEVTAEVVLFLVPVVVAVTSTEKVQLELAPRVAPLNDTEVDPAVAVIVPPPQLPLSPLGVNTSRPAGKLSVNPTPVSELVFELVIVNDSVDVLVEPTPIVDGVNDFEIDGADATVIEAFAVAPVPPLVEVIAPVVLFFTPEVVPVTLTVTVQVAPTATVPFEKVTELVPAVAVTDGAPQLPLVVSPFGVPTTSPAGKLSVNATPVSATVFPAGLTIVKTSVVVAFKEI